MLINISPNPFYYIFIQGSSQYTTDIDHYAAASIENATCTVEPASSGDVGEIVCGFVFESSISRILILI